MARGQFDESLQDLQAKLMELGRLANTALDMSVKALEEQDIEKALEIIEDDTHADLLEEEINDIAILLIAKQQPVATDLRRIIVTIKVASDIERIADFAVNIAKSTIRIGKEPLIKPIKNIKQMYTLTSNMINLTLESFVEEDVVKAKKIADLDDEIDDLYGETIRELLTLNKQQPEFTDQITQLSFICRYLERSADHATNVAEGVFYLVKGRRFDLNS
ncbi:phosphate signaling complex protein PhoU [Rossellomorea vietnamensis]|uniref:Phosphate-specific transport system accessory protein PhoU n=2 Tax=Rossellomorea TaxID=2837508 RepID=A0A5D4NZT6_9BACI|nr:MULTISPECIES: phosphate signaling complex protein PhoU [Rossellomorea]TYS19470.1 phosphate signaling complex protein PhoU [Rossellomorea vietnamensis]TYS76560.1 phosphate signaling complex protein PhoU [Rossellomorea aquimaris]